MPDDERRNLHRRAQDGEQQLRLLMLEEAVKHNARFPSAEFHEQLDRRYPTRDQLAREYVPRAEHDQKRDWTLRALMALVAIAQIIEALVLALRH